MIIYDIKETAAGRLTLMNYGFLEKVFGLSLCGEDYIKMLQVKGRDGKPLILRYSYHAGEANAEYNQRIETWINKNYKQWSRTADKLGYEQANEEALDGN